MARGIGLDMRVKKLFFDRKAVEHFMGKKTAAAMGKAAARVRLRARHSMKKMGAARQPPKRERTKKGKETAAFRRWLDQVLNPQASAPGSPPHVQTSDPIATLRNIWFAMDSASSPNDIKAVVGPLLLNQLNRFNGMTMRGTVPNLHEFGGTAGIRQKLVGRNWHPIGRRRPRPGQPTRTKQAKYPPRPFMQPALEKEAPKFPQLWLRRAA